LKKRTARFGFEKDSKLDDKKVAQLIHHRCKDRKRWRVKRSDIGAIRIVLTPSFRKPRSPSEKRTVQPGDAFEDTAFKPWRENVIF
jgi:hypothetical protein